MRAAGSRRAQRRGIALGLGLIAGLVSVAVSGCGSSSVKPAAATASVVSAPADRLVPAANDHILARLIPGARLVFYPDAGHAFLFQEGTPFASRVESFLTGSPSV